MTARGNKIAGKLEKTRVQIARRDERIADLERSRRQLETLYAISKLLTRFEGLERTIADAIAIAARTLSLRTAIFIMKTAGIPRIITWLAEGETVQRLQEAKAHAQTVYGYLVTPGVDLAHGAATPLELPRLAGRSVGAKADGKQSFVLLPFVVERGAIFGALQIEAARTLDEQDLFFVNAVVNQLAIGLERYATEQARRSTEAKLAGIVSGAADAIISIDEHQHIAMYNEAAERVFGWRRDEVLGKPFDVLLPERFRDRHRQHFRAFATEPEAARKVGTRATEIFALRKTGEEFPADAAISKVDAGGAWLFTVILRDITEQKRVEHDERFLADVGAALATTLDAQETLASIAKLVLGDLADFCIVDLVDDRGETRRLHVASSDPAKAAIVEALKQLALDPSRPSLSSILLQAKQSQLIATVAPDTLQAISQSEEHRRLIEAIGPTSIMGVLLVAQGRLLGTLIVASCRPERRYGASDLRLLEEVGRRAALALENARLYRAVQSAVKARDRVLGIVAHDLRGPLSTIVLQASLLRLHGPEQDHGSRRPAETIERAAKRMTRLIEDLLDVTRIEAGQLSINLARVAAGQVVSDAVEAQQPLAASASLELRRAMAPNVPEVWADRDRLLQVFENLIGNAIKFTRPPGDIVAGAVPRDGEVLFWVTDTGAGIDAEDIPHLFDRFWQARRTERRGAGLGLAIVKDIVEAHGGRIWVESTPGQGSTFLFTIPTPPPADAWRETPAPQTT